MLNAWWWRLIGGLCAIAGLSLLHSGPGWNGIVTFSCGALILLCSGTVRRDVFGFALLIGAGQAATMEALDTSRYAVYEHLPVWGAFSEPGAALLHVVVALILAIGVAATNRTATLAHVIDWCRRHLWRTLFICAAITFPAAVPARSVVATLSEFVLGSVLSLGMMGAAVCLVCAVHDLGTTPGPRAQALAALLSWPGQDSTERTWDGAAPWILAVTAVCLASAASVVVFDGMPHIDDSVSYLFQAKSFAAGRLWLDAPADSAAFHVDEVIVDGTRWFGYGFPGWPVALAAGVRTGVAWFINPLVAGLSVLLIHGMTRRWYDRGTANVTALLLVASPWFLVMSAEFMPHPLSLALTAGALYCTIRTRGGENLLWSAGTGVALGWLALTRPLDAVLVALLCGVIVLGIRPLARAVRSALLSSGLAVAIGLMIIPYNSALTGRADYTPQMMWTDRRWGPGVDRFGFGAEIGVREWSQIDPLPGHGLIDVILNLNKNLAVTQRELFGWGAGSLVLIVLLLSLGRPQRRDAIWWGLGGAFVLGYSGYWFSGGPDLGARYWYPALIALVILTARGIHQLHQPAADRRLGWALAVTATTLSFWAATVFVPSRIDRKYLGYRNITGEVRALSDSLALSNDLVFIASPERAHYQAAFNLNVVPVSAGHPLYASDAGSASRRRVIEAFPGRRIWIFAADSAGGRLSVTAGPLPPGTIP